MSNVEQKKDLVRQAMALDLADVDRLIKTAEAAQASVQAAIDALSPAVRMDPGVTFLARSMQSGMRGLADVRAAVETAAETGEYTPTTDPTQAARRLLRERQEATQAGTGRFPSRQDLALAGASRRGKAAE